jgi:hypothetical protein
MIGIESHTVKLLPEYAKAKQIKFLFGNTYKLKRDSFVCSFCRADGNKLVKFYFKGNIIRREDFVQKFIIPARIDEK